MAKTLTPNKEKTFAELWEESYKAYLKLRQKFNIPLTEDQKRKLNGGKNAK